MLIAARKRNQAGFTLIEISIVIIAVAFLILGILKAGDVIRTGRLNKIVSDFTKYEMAGAAFKTKFLFLPGDMPDARNRLNNCSGTSCTNGNSNGIIGRPRMFAGTDQTGTNMPQLETSMFWQHLLRADFIEGVSPTANPATPLIGETHPTSPAAGAYSVFHRRAYPRQPESHGISLKACPDSNNCGREVLDVRDVAYIDQKIDGSLDPSTGQVIGGGASCDVNTGVYTYNATPCYIAYLTNEF